MVPKIAFLYTHPIQYFAPLHREISKMPDAESVVLFCEDTTKGYFDEQFGQRLRWDTPLTEGYDFVFLKNSGISKLGGPFKYSNFAIGEYVKTGKCDILVVHGWGYFTSIYAILLAKFRGIKVWLRAESPINHEFKRSKISLFLRRIVLGSILFPLIDKFLYIGEQNRKFYEFYGVTPGRFIYAPYSVNNKYFTEKALELRPQKEINRIELGIPANKKVILFSGKLIEKKRPLDLLEAFDLLPKELDAFLIFVGDGALRGKMEEFIREKGIKNVTITGFINQSQIPIYYSIADIFVMCSEFGETWGLSANEAMNFEVPVLISDQSGSFADLVKGNGYVFKTGDIEDLLEKLTLLLTRPESEMSKMKLLSGSIVKNFSYEKVIDGLTAGIHGGN